MSIYKLNPAKDSKSKKIRKGRGNASGKGGESGRGHKGQRSRSGFSQMSGFEGGQNPLYRRVPKKRGLKLKPNISTKFHVLNLSSISESFMENDIVDMKILREKFKIKRNVKVKILGDGDITKPLTFKDLSFSKSAEDKIKLAKGTISTK